VRSSGGAVSRSAGRPLSGLAVALALVVGCWLTVDVLVGGPLTAADHRVSDAVRATGVRASDWPQPMFLVKLGVYAVTKLGALGPMVVVATAIAVGVAWRRRTWRPMVLLLLGLGLLAVSAWALKHAVARTTPATDLVHAPTGRSFPSGHAATAVVLWGLLGWFATQYRLPVRLAWPLRVLRWLAPLLTCVAMLLLDYHWLTDLLAGLALGIVVLRMLYEIDVRAPWVAGPATPPAATPTGPAVTAPPAAEPAAR
jgi:membrane-associated phospholipid phosphatase